MKYAFLLLSTLCSLFALSQKADEPNTKFGKIAPADLAPTVYAIDSSAPAVVLFDVGQSEIIGNNSGSLSMVFKRHRRIHILAKAGYEHADVSISLYKDGLDETSLEQLKAVTYNLQDGKVVETKLEKKDIFTEQIDKNRSRIKFTFPAVKEGSVIEYDYTIESDFYFSLMPWEFQGSIPRLWSEYRFSLPQFMDYLFLAQGYFPFHLKEQKDRRGHFTFSDNSSAMQTSRSTLDCNVTNYRWVMKDVPVLKEESFTSTLDNHIAKIQFQLAGYKDPLQVRQIMTNWPAAAKSLLERDDFGRLFLAPNNWLDDDVKAAIAGANGEEEKAKRIYAYVRNSFTCSDYSEFIPDQNLRNLVKTKKGTVAEINILLIAMLRTAGIDAAPVVLSTRENGYANPVYPFMNQLNYLVCQAQLGGKAVYLDAAHPQLGFGRLMYNCYNGAARVINEEAPPVDFIADSLLETKSTFVMYSNVQGKWSGRAQQMPGYYESLSLRKEIKSDGKDALAKKLQKGFSGFAKVDNVRIDSLDRLELPLTLHFDLEPEADGEDILYINPFSSESYSENPFKSAVRYYPVEMPYAMKEVHTVNMEIPEGYAVDEVPKSIRMLMNEEGDGRFEYLSSVSNGIIAMRMTLQINRTFFAPDEYEMLREFFNRVVSKQSEQIVLKKKK